MYGFFSFRYVVRRKTKAPTKRWSHVWNITYWNDTIGYCKWIDPFTLFAQCSRTQHKSHMFAEFIRHDITARAVWFFSFVFFIALQSVCTVQLLVEIFFFSHTVVAVSLSRFKANSKSIHFNFILNSLDSLEPQSQVHSVGRRKTCGERKKRLVVYY